MLYVPHASFGELRDWMDACWRLYYAERIAELATVWKQQVGYGDPLDVEFRTGRRVWQTIEPPVAVVFADGKGEYLAKLNIDDHTLQTRPRAVEWLTAGLVATLPESGALDAVPGGLPEVVGQAGVTDLESIRAGSAESRSHRARMLLGMSAGGQRVDIARRVYGFRLDSAEEKRSDLSRKWRNVLNGLGRA